MKDFLSIKEFSDLSGIEATTLRYWDDIGLFSPTMRNPENGYRYYSPRQLISVKFITVLSKLRFPLKTIDNLEPERTPERMMDMMMQQEKKLELEMRDLHLRYSIMITRRELINYGMGVDESKISVVFREEKSLVLGPPNRFVEGEGFYEAFSNFYNKSDQLYINLGYPIGGYHETMESFLAAPGEPDRFFSLDPAGREKRMAGDYLVGFHRGYYGDMGDVHQRMADYARKHSIKIHGPVYSIYLFDEICVKDPLQYLCQVCVAVSR